MFWSILTFVARVVSVQHTVIICYMALFNAA
jgi:hypothetical protein